MGQLGYQIHLTQVCPFSPFVKATTRKLQRMTKEVITRGWLRDALDKALSEEKAKPSPVQQFAFNVKHGKPDRDKAA